MCVCVDTHKLNFIYACVIHFQVIHELKLLPFVVKDVEQKVKSFRFYSDEVSLSDSNGWWNQRISTSVWPDLQVFICDKCSQSLCHLYFISHLCIDRMRYVGPFDH